MTIDNRRLCGAPWARIVNNLVNLLRPSTVCNLVQVVFDLETITPSTFLFHHGRSSRARTRLARQQLPDRPSPLHRGEFVQNLRLSPHRVDVLEINRQLCPMSHSGDHPEFPLLIS